MNKLKFIYILMLMVSMLFSEEKSWTTTTFEYYWNLGFNRIRFREPVNFTPFEARAGYLTYGGDDYWNNLTSTDLGKNSPVLLDSTNNSFESLEPKESRTLFFIEFDFMKFNFPNFLLQQIGWSQNFFDIQAGLGYRYIHSIGESEFPEYWEDIPPDDQSLGTLIFKPRIHDFNFNTSIDFQPLGKIRAYLYHSLGYSWGTIYQYKGAGTYLQCNGISEGLGLGLRYIHVFEKYNFNLIYSIEARLHRSYIYHIEDPSDISYINGLDMYSKGLIFSIGTIFGSQKTSADHSFLKMLNGNYLSAESGFENYINTTHPSRKKLAKKMLEFTQSQMPYEQYNNGLNHQYLGNIDSAIYWFNESSKKANDELLFEINTHKRDLAIMLIDSVNIYKNNMTFEDAENIILKAKTLVNDYYYIDEMLSDLYIEKGDALESAGNYNKAYIYYNEAQRIYSNSYVKLIEKYYSLTANLIKQANTALDNKEYTLAIESLNFALDISPDRKQELEPMLNDLYSQLSLEELTAIRENIKDLVERKKQEIKNSKNKKILIGMSSNEVENAIGLPGIKDTIEKGDRLYELWTYNNHPSLSKIYFEENLVIKVE